MENLDYNFVLEFARRKHEGQFRDDKVTPYIEHPIKVAELVRHYKKSKNIDAIVAAALLHDTMEDTYTSYRELVDNFGEMVASMVLEVTSAKMVLKLKGKACYLKHKMNHMSPYALVIKLADRLANLRDMKGVSEEKLKRTEEDTIEIIDYLENPNNEYKLTEAQRNLITDIRAEIENLKRYQTN